MWRAVLAGQEVVPLDRDWLFTAIVLVDDTPYAHLAVRLHSKPRTTTYAGSVVRFAARVLQMIGLAASSRAEQERAARVAVLRDLLEAGTPDRTLLERVNAHGFRADTIVRIMVADVPDPARLGGHEVDGLRGAFFAGHQQIALAVGRAAVHDDDKAALAQVIERQLNRGEHRVAHRRGMALERAEHCQDARSREPWTRLE